MDQFVHTCSHVCVFKGVPLPSQEQKAIDAVMQYAVHRLGFQPESIILFAWSIGGYAASWAAMNYPDVSHVVSNIIVRASSILRHADFHTAPWNLPFAAEFTVCLGKTQNCPFFAIFLSNSRFFSRLFNFTIYKTNNKI